MGQDTNHPLAARMVGFVEHLRLNDFTVGIAETEVAVGLLARPDFMQPRAARQSLKALLTGRHEEWTRFDDLFEAYWFARGRERQRARTAASDGARTNIPGQKLWREHLGTGGRATDASPAGEGDAEIPGAPSGRLIASDRPTRMRTDLRHVVDRDEIAAAERLAYRLARAIRYRLSRRYRVNRHGARLDMRRHHPRQFEPGRRAYHPDPPRAAGPAGAHRRLPGRLGLHEALQPLLPAIRQGPGPRLARRRRLPHPHQTDPRHRRRGRGAIPSRP